MCNARSECFWTKNACFSKDSAKKNSKIQPNGDCPREGSALGDVRTSSPSVFTRPPTPSDSPVHTMAPSTLACPKDSPWCAQGRNPVCANPSEENPHGCICLQPPRNMNEHTNANSTCVQATPCSELFTTFNVCRFQARSDRLILPDPEDDCYKRGGQCLMSCCSEVLYYCYEPCSM